MVFIRRLSRVSALVETEEGAVLRAHLTNTGRLLDILHPGISLLAVPIQGKRTQVRILGSPAGRSLWTVLDTRTQERAIEELLRRERLPGWEGWKFLRRNPSVGKHRLDFLVLDAEGSLRWLEVKSAVYFFPEDRSARYPDTVTVRAHAQFRWMLRHPVCSALLFVCAHPEAERFRPSRDDPTVARLIEDVVRSGIPVSALRLWLEASGWLHVDPSPLPVEIRPG